MWVAGFGAVSRLDPVTGRIEDRVRTPNTGDYSRIAVGDGSVWITAGGGAVYRIDPSTNRVVATVHLGGSVQGVAVGAARVWVTRPSNGAGEVIRIDPRTNRVAGPPIKVGPGPGQVIYGQHAVWVQNSSPASVMRIDPATGHVVTIVGARPADSGSPVAGAIAVGHDSLWAATDDVLMRVDPGTGQVVASLPIPRGVAVAIGAHEIWVLAYPRSSSPTVFDPIKHTAALWEVNPKTDRIIGKPIRLDALQPIAVTAIQRNVWVADYDSATVTQLRLVADAHPEGKLADRYHLTSDGIGSLRLGQPPEAVAAGLERLFGPPAPAGTASRIGYVPSICGFDHEIDWAGLAARSSGFHSVGLTVYFKRSRLVGYSYGPPYGGSFTPQVHHGLMLSTSKGLGLGETLARARRLYGRAFGVTTQAQGTPPSARLPRLPVWTVPTASGRIYGFTDSPGGPRSPHQRSIGSISAGAIPNTPCR